MGQHDDYAPLCVMFRVKDMKRSMAFYGDALGFERKEVWPENEPVFASFKLGTQVILLGANMDPSNAEAACGKGPELELFRAQFEAFARNRAGVGVTVYLKVDDVDAFHARVRAKAKTLTAPKTQFYGQRDFLLEDPDGYQLAFYAPVKMESCQSCGMPLPDSKEGQMYCQYCVDETGKLRPYESVLEGCINFYFIPQQKMARPEAEKAAKAHLAKMPAWSMRG